MLLNSLLIFSATAAEPVADAPDDSITPPVMVNVQVQGALWEETFVLGCGGFVEVAEERSFSIKVNPGPCKLWVFASDGGMRALGTSVAVDPRENTTIAVVLQTPDQSDFLPLTPEEFEEMEKQAEESVSRCMEFAQLRIGWADDERTRRETALCLQHQSLLERRLAEAEAHLP